MEENKKHCLQKISNVSKKSYITTKTLTQRAHQSDHLRTLRSDQVGAPEKLARTKHLCILSLWRQEHPVKENDAIRQTSPMHLEN